MSVRAYIVLGCECDFVDYEGHQCMSVTKYEDQEPLFNVWHHPEFFDIIRENGWDQTNNDSCGYIGIDVCDWKEAIENLSEDEIAKLKNCDNGFGEEILNRINKYLDENDELELSCY